MIHAHAHLAEVGGGEVRSAVRHRLAEEDSPTKAAEVSPTPKSSRPLSLPPPSRRAATAMTAAHFDAVIYSNRISSSPRRRTGVPRQQPGG